MTIPRTEEGVVTDTTGDDEVLSLATFSNDEDEDDVDVDVDVDDDVAAEGDAEHVGNSTTSKQPREV